MSNRDGFFWKAIDAGTEISPIATLLGWQLIDAGDGERPFRVRFQGRPEFRNPAGNIQGGVLASMLDETLSPALASLLGPGEFPATLEMKVSFTAPAKVGEIFGEARIVSLGKTICFLEASLREEGGRLVATASATAMLQRPNASG